MLIATSSGLLFLAVLACPVGMGLMMFFMGRGMGGMKHKNDRQSEDRDSSLAEMKAEQARLAEKIETLEARQTPPHADAPSADREPDPVS